VFRAAKADGDTVGVRLTAWTLSDGSHPALYCAPRTAEGWSAAKKAEGASIFSVVGELISKTVRHITAPSAPPPAETEIRPLFERYYQDGATVLTPFGYGTVRTFRETDGFYHLSLVGWQMKGPHPTAYFSGDSLSYGIAKGCVEGYPVYTSLGLTGILISVEPTTGAHVSVRGPVPVRHRSSIGATSEPAEDIGSDAANFLFSNLADDERDADADDEPAVADAVFFPTFL